MPDTSRYAPLGIAVLVAMASACDSGRGQPPGSGAGNAGATNGSPQTSVEPAAGQAASDAAVPNDAAAFSETSRDAASRGDSASDAAVVSGPRSDAAAVSGPRGDAATASAPGSDAANDGAAPQDSASKPLVELTDSELEALCKWMEDLHVMPSKVQLCTSRSLQATSQAACTASVAACVASDNVDASVRPQCDPSFVRKLPKHCTTLTTQDYRSCAAAAADASNQHLASLSCSQLNSPRPAGAGSELPACAMLVRMCPELAPEGSGAASTWSGGSFLCPDGWPLFMNEVCNGIPDCLGGEDEKSCERR